MGGVFVGFVALVLALMAVLPLLGFNLILLLGPVSLEPFDPSIEPIYTCSLRVQLVWLPLPFSQLISCAIGDL